MSIIIVIVPFLINIIFKINTGIRLFQAEWSPDAFLTYIGSILGAVATIIAVKITIDYTSEQKMKEYIILSKPWITSKLELLNANNEIINQENGSTLFISLNGNDFGSSTKVPFSIRKGTHEINKKDCVIKYSIKNVGGNTATFISMSLNGQPLLPDFALNKTDEKIFVMMLPLVGNQDETEYKIQFLFGDIISEIKYKQEEIVIVKKDDYSCTVVQSQNNLITAPKQESQTN